MIRSLWRRMGFMALSVFLVGLGAVLHAACEKVTGTGRAATQRPEDLKEALARIDDVVITVGEFQDRINKQSPFVRARYTSLERKKEFLDNLVRFEVLAREAQRRGLDKDPEVIRTLKQALIQKLMRDEFESRMKPEDVSDADAKTYFDSHLDEFNKPEEVRVALVLLKDEKTAKKVLADPRIKGLDTADFRKLVAEYSIDTATKDRGGDLRYFDRNTKELPAPIVTAAFALTNLGDVSAPIKTSQGWNVLKLTGRRKALVRTFDEVKGQIKSRLFRDRRQAAMDAFIRDLRGKAQVEVHEDRLAKVQIEAAGPGQFEGPGVPPPGPGMFHPPGQNAPQAGPLSPGTPPGAPSISVPGQAPPPPPAPPAGEAH
ncbi:MAG TPA: peptidyl-prolyl cis-trans isomerase [Polyangia bacterium]|jgi:peptidyl-prolyl cis-trans isomerase C|nr:peptidyl-prolyl cis-trans isomerase [Polyangia bacterium]